MVKKLVALLVVPGAVLVAGCSTAGEAVEPKTPLKSPAAATSAPAAPSCAPVIQDGLAHPTSCGTGTITITSGTATLTLTNAQCYNTRFGFNVTAGNAPTGDSAKAKAAADKLQYASVSVLSKSTVKDGTMAGVIVSNDKGAKLVTSATSTNVTLTDGATKGAASGLLAGTDTKVEAVFTCA